MLQSDKLRAARWLPACYVDEKEQPLEELVYLLKVCLHCPLLLLKLAFWAYSKHLVSKLVVLKYPIK